MLHPSSSSKILKHSGMSLKLGYLIFKYAWGGGGVEEGSWIFFLGPHQNNLNSFHLLPIHLNFSMSLIDCSGLPPGCISVYSDCLYICINMKYPVPQ